MTVLPPKLSEKALTKEAEIAAGEFRTGRAAISDAWTVQYQEARAKFEMLFEKLGDLKPEGMREANLVEAYSNDLSEALRYLAGPPISEDDLRVIAEVHTLSSGVLKSNPEMLQRVFAVIERIIDPHRFPWIKSGEAVTKEQREAALVASAVLLAAQRVATVRRMEGKSGQEATVIAYLKSLHFEEVPASAIRTLVQGPKANQFCSECLLGERKADIVVRLHNTRLLAIECKVSNSELNSIKRINNDAAVKAQYWVKVFGTAQVVPAAMLSGVFKVTNLQQAQAQDLSLFWAHDLRRLGTFIKSTKRSTK